MDVEGSSTNGTGEGPPQKDFPPGQHVDDGAEKDYPIYVQISKDELKMLFVHGSTRVYDLKLKIEELTQTPPSQQILVYRGSELFDLSNMDRYELRESCTVELRLKGRMTIFIRMMDDPITYDPQPADDTPFASRDTDRDLDCTLESLWDEIWKVIYLEVEPSDTVAFVKTRIQDDSGERAEKLELYFEGRKLDDDDRSLDECQVKRNSTIFAFKGITPLLRMISSPIQSQPEKQN